MVAQSRRKKVTFEDGKRAAVEILMRDGGIPQKKALEVVDRNFARLRKW